MDVSAKTGARAWLVGAATAGLIAPGLLVAQSNRSTDGRKPAEESGVLVAETEVEHQLRLLYERDGREMPNMRLTQIPETPAQPAPRTNVNIQPRYSAAPAAARPVAPSGNRFTSFFKKLMPGSNASPPRNAVTPPRYLPPMPPRPPAFQQPQRISGPATPVAPTVPQAAARFPKPIPPTPNPAIGAPSDSAIAPAPVIQPGPSSKAFPAEEEIANEFASPAARENIDADADSEFWVDEPEARSEAELGETLDAPVQDEAAPVESMPPQLDDDFPDPFGGAVEAPPEQPEIDEPYTGKSLNADAPAPLPVPADVQPVPPSAANLPEAAPAAETTAAKAASDAEQGSWAPSTAAKMQRIIERGDERGLKGFCPVTLRDQRELADSRPEFTSSFRGQKFHFASKEAQVKFMENPRRYAPVAFGADVVLLVNHEDVVEGSLDHAAWYKGRLYLFDSEETHDTFVANPAKFAKPAGIE